MKLNSWSKWIQPTESATMMPALFLGHGSPMNAIEENEFVRGFREVAGKLPAPRAILCVSAHWETRGTWVTAMDQPRTIHDFGGFPEALYQVQYKAPGSPEFATLTRDLVKSTEIGMDHHWGLDHGSWSVIKHLYPEANVPVFQLSLDRGGDTTFHYELGKELKALRKRGILVIGSGNMVHNLRMVAWNRMQETFAFDWAAEADHFIKEGIRNQQHASLIDYSKAGKALQLAIPTPEHFLPLLYVLAMQDDNDQLTFFNDKPVAGSLTMTSLLLENTKR